MEPQRPIRVIQVATGAVGLIALRHLILHPRFELAGLWVHSPGKVGRDAGDLAGLPPAGVIATNAIEDVLAVGADCVSYMAIWPDTDVICRFLEAGLDVVTVSGLVHIEPGETRDRIEAACRKGDSSFHGTGLSPGFAGDILPLTLSGLCRDITSVRIEEFADIRSYDSVELIHDLVGMGKPLATLTAQPHSQLGIMLHESYSQSVRMIAGQLGVTLDRIERQEEYAATPNGAETASGAVPPGSVAGTRFRFIGIEGGAERIVLELTWVVADDLEAGWPVRGDGAASRWHIKIAGHPDIICALDVTGKDGIGPSLVATCMHAMNAIPHVVRAPAGIVSRLDLPLISAP